MPRPQAAEPRALIPRCAASLRAAAAVAVACRLERSVPTLPRAVAESSSSRHAGLRLLVNAKWTTEKGSSSSPTGQASERVTDAVGIAEGFASGPTLPAPLSSHAAHAWGLEGRARRSKLRPCASKTTPLLEPEAQRHSRGASEASPWSGAASPSAPGASSRGRLSARARARRQDVHNRQGDWRWPRRGRQRAGQIAEHGAAAARACTAPLQMLIKGIRSFSPENKTLIEFSKPLTLIVGANGAGKTVRASPPPPARLRAAERQHHGTAVGAPSCRRLSEVLSLVARRPSSSA